MRDGKSLQELVPVSKAEITPSETEGGVNNTQEEVKLGSAPPYMMQERAHPDLGVLDRRQLAVENVVEGDKAGVLCVGGRLATVERSSRVD